jgi:ArsR family transcriptional regulator, arsenate/arsenite/antimonite-responsive transcriptional repressor
LLIGSNDSAALHWRPTQHFHIIGTMDSDPTVLALAALAQPSRLAVFRLLVETAPDGAFPGDIAARLDIPQNTLSFHLKTLAHAGLVNSEQNGRFIRYRANTALMQELVAFLTHNCCGGDASKCAPSAAVTCPPPAAKRTSTAPGRKR